MFASRGKKKGAGPCPAPYRTTRNAGLAPASVAGLELEGLALHVLEFYGLVRGEDLSQLLVHGLIVLRRGFLHLFARHLLIADLLAQRLASLLLLGREILDLRDLIRIEIERLLNLVAGK